MKRKTLLYIMPVSWFWIKQRPQFIAGGLSEFFDVSVACLHDYNAEQKLKAEEGQNKHLKLYGTPTFNFIFKSGFLNTIQFWVKKLFLNWLIYRSEIVVFTVPEQIIYPFKTLLKSRIVVYDCMDDMPAFHEDNISHKNQIIAHEKLLSQLANKIIVSSGVLKSRIAQRYLVDEKKLTVINNGIRLLDFRTADTGNLKQLFSDHQFQYLVYFGTVSEWFDMDLMKKLLDKHSNLKLIIFGPTDTALPISSNIIYGGILKHHQIESAMILSDALIMPFKITELILAVNPVKAYEYIASGKPVILTEYDETKKFDEFAYLYNCSEELDLLFYKLSVGKLMPRQNSEMCERFGLQNNWSQRIKIFAGVIGQ